MNKLTFVLTGALLALAAVLAFQPQLATAQGDPVMGDELTVTYTGAADSTGQGDAVTTAYSGKRTVLLGGVFQSDTAGVVLLQDGSDGDVIGALYLKQNVPLVLDPSDIGDGIKTTAGNEIYAELSGATIAFTMRIRREG